MKPIAFMTAFMKNLVDLGEDKDKYEKTIKLLTPYANSQAIIDAIHSDIASASSPTNFLLNKCGIDLDNADVGGLLGYDTSGNTAITATDVLNESGITLTTPPSTSVTIDNFRITFPDLSTLTAQGQFIIKALYSWWYPLAFNTIKSGYGLSITDTSYVKTMDTDLFDEAPSNGAIRLAYVETSFSVSTGIPTSLSCRININSQAYGNIDITNENGYAPVLGTNYLDRTLLHELTHALMSTNIQWFATALPTYFKEGTAELINGCDDTRSANILTAVTNVTVFNDGLSESPVSNLDWYTTGYIYLRYLIKQISSYAPIISDGFKLPSMEIYEDSISSGIRFEHGIVRYSNFKSIFLEYMDFIQRSSDTVVPWKLCTGSDFDSFKGATFRIPISGSSSKITNDIATIVAGNTLSPSTNIGYTTDVAKDAYTDNNPIGLIGGIWSNGITFEQLLSNIESNIDTITTIEIYIGIGYGIDTVRYGYGGLTVTSAWNNLITLINSKNIHTDIVYVGGTHDLDYIYNSSITTSQYISDITNNEFFKGYYSIYQTLVSNTNVTLHDISKNILINYPTIDSLKSNIHSIDDGTGTNNNIICYSNNFNGYITSILDYMNTISQSVKVSSKTEITTPCYYLSLNYNKNFDYSSYVTNNYLTNQEIISSSDLVENMINNGEFVPFTVHTLYDKGLYACEQGGASGKFLFDYIKHSVDYDEFGASFVRTDANLLNKYPANISSRATPPIPGTGTPWFTYSSTDASKYTTIEFYFTKTNYNSSLVLNFYNDSDSSITPIWNTLSFGVMNTDEDSYKFPLFICGGTTALKPSETTYYNNGTGPIWIYGNRYNLDIKQNNLSSTNLLYPTRLKNTNITNSMILAPDGVWKYVYNYTQGLDRLVQPESLEGQYPVPKYCTMPSSLSVNDEDNSCIYPTISDTLEIDHLYNSTGSLNNELIPISILSNKSSLMEEVGISGTLPNIYSSNDIGKYGIITKNSTRYLIIPNGWKDRVPYYRSFTYDGSTDVSSSVLEYFADINKYKFTQSLIIKVGDIS